MKNVKIKSEGINHVAIDLGLIDQLMDYSYMHPKRHQEVKGKVFVGEILKSTSAEISFTVIPPKTEMPFMHQHKNHEEIYIFLKGSGQFQVDDSIFDVSEGSIIRISPNGKRIYRNNSDNPLIFLCVQNQAGSLNSFNVEDGFLAEGEILWKK
ncbi:MAG: cupin domain-containing protein [Bacteroidales bacterium]|nr:cupin domain-containing protein [Bacteroidales bacterium]